MADPIDRWIEVSSEIFYPRREMVSISVDDIAFLKKRAAESPRGRCRICLHGHASDALHDMVIVLARGAYVRPQRHFVKAETMVALEGDGIYIRFAPDGRPIAHEWFSATGSINHARVLRAPINEYHGLLITSEWLVFCESTLGPFDPAGSEFAPWSPAPADQPAVERFLADLHEWIEAA